MPRKKPTGLYRVLLRDAWNATWHRKHLWVFGIFAALISTGGVLDVTLNSIKRMKAGGTLLERFLDSSFIGYDLFGAYITQLGLLGHARVSILVLSIVLLVILLLVMAIVSQAALILGAKSKKIPDVHALRQKGWGYFWPIFIVDVFTKFFTGLLVVLTTLPLFLFFVQTSGYNAILFAVLSIVFFAGILIINIISILAIIDIVEKGDGATHAIRQAWRLFRRQWVATIEYAVIQFFLVLIAGFLLLALVALLSMPYAVIYSTSLLSGSFLIFLVSNVLFALLVALVVLGFSGAVVTFQYHAWYGFYKRGMHKVHGSKLMSKLHRLFHG